MRLDLRDLAQGNGSEAVDLGRRVRAGRVPASCWAGSTSRGTRPLPREGAEGWLGAERPERPPPAIESR